MQSGPRAVSSRGGRGASYRGSAIGGVLSGELAPRRAVGMVDFAAPRAHYRRSAPARWEAGGVRPPARRP